MTIIRWAVTILALLAGSAEAQTFSAGLSVPLLEFQPGQTHPVAFAPGAGVEASVSFFPTTIDGEEADLLAISGIAFASAPGSFQLGLTLGTFNDLLCLGAAVPLYTSTNGGAAQGSFHVYPLLGGNLTFDLGSPPPELVAGTENPKKKRFGVIYLHILQ